MRMTIRADIEKALAKLRAASKAPQAVFADPQFGAAVQSYITGVTSRMMRELSDVGDAPASKSARGVTWPGFATWPKTKYGQQVTEGTRYYWRGRKARGGAYVFDADADDPRLTLMGHKFVGLGKAGKKSIRQTVGDVTLEKAWRKRASGARYSASAKMLRDTDALLGFTAFVRRTVEPNALVLKAGERPKYFREQHERRPIWFWYPPTDGPRVRAIFERAVARLLAVKTA